MDTAGRSSCDRWIIAHRGVSAHCPENTRAAFEAAVQCEADAVELDLQLTADDGIIVCHDAVLDRYGHSGVAVAEHSLKKLQTMDVGSWFGTEFHGQKLMSIGEVLHDFGERIPLFLELKVSDIPPCRIPVFLDCFLQSVTEYRNRAQMFVLCFDLDLLRQLSDKIPWLPMIWNTRESAGIAQVSRMEGDWLCGIDCRVDQLSADVVADIHRHTVSAFSFTCNQHEDVLKALKSGVDGIITDDPQQTRSLLTQRLPQVA